MVNHKSPRRADRTGFTAQALLSLDEAAVHSLRRPRPTPEISFGPATTGPSPATERLRSQIKRIAPYFRTALITGPQGTSKEGVARMLHAHSPCAAGEFIACEATALAEAMLREDGRALLDAAAGATGGTLYLDDVGEVPPALQSALLRIWTSPGRARIRVITATHRDLRTMGITGQFRPDLAQRLMGVEIATTPLAARPEDLPAVVAEVLRKLSTGAALTLTPEALDLLHTHTWPGDIAEIERALWTAARNAAPSLTLEAQHLPQLLPADVLEPEEASMERLDTIVQQHVLGVLTRCGGNKLRAAEILGISRSTLYRMLDTHVGSAFTD